jgi:phosphocarrier protein
MRPATAFAQRAAAFPGTVTVHKAAQRVNGKSPLEMLLLGAAQGTELMVEVSGAGAEAAAQALAALLEAPSADDAPAAPLPSGG